MNIVDKILFDPITRGLKFFTKGGVVVSQSPVGMSDQLATQLGLKQYLHGTTYNGGSAPALSGPAGLTDVFSRFIPYQMQDGEWRLKFNIACVITAATQVDITVGGVTFANVPGATAYQAISASSDTSAQLNYGLATENTGLITIQYNLVQARVYASGDVALASKPTWAY